MTACRHIDTIRAVTPSSRGCEECLKSGSVWLHLRLCRQCGHVGCCDDSPHRHATAHFHATRHAIIEGYDPPGRLGLVLYRRGSHRPARSDSTNRPDSALLLIAASFLRNDYERTGTVRAGRSVRALAAQLDRGGADVPIFGGRWQHDRLTPDPSQPSGAVQRGAAVNRGYRGRTGRRITYGVVGYYDDAPEATMARVLESISRHPTFRSRPSLAMQDASHRPICRGWADGRSRPGRA